MPKLKNHIPKLCRHHKGQAFVKIDGSQVWLGRYGDALTQEKYDRLIAEWLANGRSIPMHIAENDPSPISVTEVIAEYWSYSRAMYAENTIHKIKSALRPLQHLYGSMPACEFGPKALVAVRQSMIERGLARSTINDLVAVIKRMFKWSVANELVPSNVYQALRAVDGLYKDRSAARETDPVSPVPDAHVAAIQPHVSRQIWGLVQLQLLTAARSGDIVKTRPVDLDTSGGIWLYSPLKHKTAHRGHKRTIYIGPRAQSVIRQFLSDRPLTSYMFSPLEAEAERHSKVNVHRRSGQNPRQPKTVRKLGERYTVNSYRRAIQRACRKAGVPRWHPHQLRHNAGTFVRREFGVEAAQVMLGHRRADVTQIYAQANAALAEEVAAQIG